MKTAVVCFALVFLCGCAAAHRFNKGFADSFFDRREPEKPKTPIAVGMTQEQVVTNWGAPVRINKSGGADGIAEQWVYGHSDGIANTYLYFENGRLKYWQAPGARP